MVERWSVMHLHGISTMERISGSRCVQSNHTNTTNNKSNTTTNNSNITTNKSNTDNNKRLLIIRDC